MAALTGTVFYYHGYHMQRSTVYKGRYFSWLYRIFDEDNMQVGTASSEIMAMKKVDRGFPNAKPNIRKEAAVW